MVNQTSAILRAIFEYWPTVSLIIAAALAICGWITFCCGYLNQNKKGLVVMEVKLNPVLYEKLEQLRKLGNLETQKDLSNVAYTLLEWAAEEVMSGGTIVAIDERERIYKQLDMDFLTACKTNSPYKKLSE